MNITFSVVKNMQDKHAVQLALNGWQELLDRGLCRGEGVLVHWNRSAIVAFVDERPAGVLVYHADDDYHVDLGYVAPEFRRTGVFSAMLTKLLEICKADTEHNVTEIRGLTYPANTEMRAGAAKHGFTEEGITIVLKVTK